MFFPDSFSQWLQETAQDVGAHSAACIRMDNPALRKQIEKNNALTEVWLKSGRQGEMDYLERMFPDKSNPWKTFPFAKSVIVLSFTNQWGDPDATHPFPMPGNDALFGHNLTENRE